MEINEFVHETITQIVKGVAKTNETFSTEGDYIASKDVCGGDAYRKEGNVMKNVVMVDFDMYHKKKKKTREWEQVLKWLHLVLMQTLVKVAQMKISKQVVSDFVYH